MNTAGKATAVGDVFIGLSDGHRRQITRKLPVPGGFYWKFKVLDGLMTGREGTCTQHYLDTYCKKAQ